MQIFFFFLIFDSIIFYVKVRTFVRVIFKNYTQPMLLFYHAMIMSSPTPPPHRLGFILVFQSFDYEPT